MYGSDVTLPINGFYKTKGILLDFKLNILIL